MRGGEHQGEGWSERGRERDRRGNVKMMSEGGTEKGGGEPQQERSRRRKGDGKEGEGEEKDGASDTGR